MSRLLCQLSYTAIKILDDYNVKENLCQYSALQSIFNGKL